MLVSVEAQISPNPVRPFFFFFWSDSFKVSSWKKNQQKTLCLTDILFEKDCQWGCTLRMFHPLWSTFLQVCVSERINGRWRKSLFFLGGGDTYYTKGVIAPVVILSASSTCMKESSRVVHSTSRTHTHAISFRPSHIR